MVNKKRQRFISKILAINDLTPTVKEFILSTPDDFDFYAGQFLTLKFSIPCLAQVKSNQVVGRAYSIASTPSLKGRAELCVKLVNQGKVTPTLFEKPPSEVRVVGPMGKFYLKEEHQGKELVFIATGTGIAPLKSMIEELLCEKGYTHPIILITGVRYEEEMLYQPLWNRLKEKFPNFHHEGRISQPRENGFIGLSGRVTDSLPRYLKRGKKQQFIVCGLKEMIHSVNEILFRHQVQEEFILYEKYD